MLWASAATDVGCGVAYLLSTERATLAASLIMLHSAAFFTAAPDRAAIEWASKHVVASAAAIWMSGCAPVASPC